MLGDSSLGPPHRRRVSAANLEGEDSALALRSPKHRANFIRTVRRALLPFNAKVLASFGGKSNETLQCASMACRRGSCPFAVLVERNNYPYFCSTRKQPERSKPAPSGTGVQSLPCRPCVSS